MVPMTTMEAAMSRVHPFKRIQVAAAAFTVLGLALMATAEPLPILDLAGNDLASPVAESVEANARAAATSRRAWRDQLPAMILVRRARPS